MAGKAVFRLIVYEAAGGVIANVMVFSPGLASESRIACATSLAQCHRYS